ncbi:hypothetical protein ACVWZK_009469 [Bradyrhizobium sp. GM0.4]
MHNRSFESSLSRPYNVIATDASGKALRQVQ